MGSTLQEADDTTSVLRPGPRPESGTASGWLPRVAAARALGPSAAAFTGALEGAGSEAEYLELQLVSSLGCQPCRSSCWYNVGLLLVSPHLFRVQMRNGYQESRRMQEEAWSSGSWWCHPAVHPLGLSDALAEACGGPGAQHPHPLSWAFHNHLIFYLLSQCFWLRFHLEKEALELSLFSAKS